MTTPRRYRALQQFSASGGFYVRSRTRRKASHSRRPSGTVGLGSRSPSRITPAPPTPEEREFMEDSVPCTPPPPRNPRPLDDSPQPPDSPRINERTSAKSDSLESVIFVKIIEPQKENSHEVKSSEAAPFGAEVTSETRVVREDAKRHANADAVRQQMRDNVALEGSFRVDERDRHANFERSNNVRYRRHERLNKREALDDLLKREESMDRETINVRDEMNWDGRATHLTQLHVGVSAALPALESTRLVGAEAEQECGEDNVEVRISRGRSRQRNASRSISISIKNNNGEQESNAPISTRTRSQLRRSGKLIVSYIIEIQMYVN